MRRLLLVSVMWIFLAANLTSAIAQQVKPEATRLVNEANALLLSEEGGRRSSDADADAAIAKLENAMMIQPKYYEAYVALGIAYRVKAIWMGEKAETIKDSDVYVSKSKEVLQIAIKLAPDKPVAYHEYLHVARDLEWKKTVRRLYELEPNDPDVMYYKGNDLIDEGKIEEGTPLVLKGMRGVDEGDVWAKKEELARTLRKKGYAKKADEITRSVNNDKKYHEGKMQLMYRDVDNGLRLIKESVDGDLNKLDAAQKASVAKELENRQRYKDAAQIFELIDPTKYQEHIRDLKNKADSQKKSKSEER